MLSNHLGLLKVYTTQRKGNKTHKTLHKVYQCGGFNENAPIGSYM